MLSQIRQARWEKLRGNPPMYFYCWHDAQVRQLRFSLVSAWHGRLPFACAIDETATLAAVAERIVHGDWRNPTWGAAAPDDAANTCAAGLPVFVAHLR